MLACDCTNSLNVHHAFIIECLVHGHLKNNSTHAESPNNDKQQQLLQHEHFSNTDICKMQDHLQFFPLSFLSNLEDYNSIYGISMLTI